MMGFETEATGVIKSYLEQRIGELDRLYHWKIPPRLPFEGSVTGGILAAQNIALKSALHDRWVANERERYAIASWYVSEWGGIRRNREATIRRYVEADPDGVASSPLQGVASWSKVLVVRDPDRFVIFDARVSAALNALFLSAGYDRNLFPVLPSRNGRIASFQAAIRGHIPALGFQRPAGCYLRYVAMLREATSRLGDNGLARGEMLLFADAENLVEAASGRLG